MSIKLLITIEGQKIAVGKYIFNYLSRVWNTRHDLLAMRNPQHDEIVTVEDINGDTYAISLRKNYNGILHKQIGKVQQWS